MHLNARSRGITQLDQLITARTSVNDAMLLTPVAVYSASNVSNDEPDVDTVTVPATVDVNENHIDALAP